jgi:hypothetical protein
MAIKLHITSPIRNPIVPVPKTGGGVKLHLTAPVVSRPNDVGTAPVSTYKPFVPAPSVLAKPAPTLYNPSIIPTFNKAGVLEKNPATQTANLMTGLDYFNRYAETALSTLGILTDTYTGYAWNKDTWSIAKQRIAESYSQIWSPPALTAAGVPAAVGQAAGNILSLAGEAIVAWQMGKAVVQTTQQLQTTGRRIWGMGKIDEVLTAVDDLKARVSAAGEGATVMPESQSYETLISSVARASENPTQETMGQMMSDYATAIQKSTVVLPTEQTQLTGTVPTPPVTDALVKLADTLANPDTQASLATFVKALPANITPGIAAVPLTVRGAGVPVGQPVTVAKPPTTLAEIPKAVPVGQPQTVSGVKLHVLQPSAIVQRAAAQPVAQVAPAPVVAPVTWTTEKVVSAIRSGQGLIPQEVLVQFAKDNPNGIVDSEGKLIKVVVPVTAEGQTWEPKVVKVVLPDGSTDFPTTKREVAQVTPVTPQISPVATISIGQHSVSTSTPATAPQNAPVAEVVPAVSKAEITPSIEQPSVVPVGAGAIQDSVVETQLVAAIKTKIRGAKVTRLPDTAEGSLRFLVETSHTIVLRQVSDKLARLKGILINNTGASTSREFVFDRAIAESSVAKYSPSVTNITPLPAGQTGLGEVVPQVTNITEPFPVSGTSNTIPTDNDTISRITVALDKVAAAKKSGGITKQTIDEFYQAMVEAKVPAKAIYWKAYHKIENVASPEKRTAMVADAVQKYNDKVLAEQMARGKASAAVKRVTAEKFTALKEQTQEQIEKNGQELMAKAKKAMEGQKFGEDLALAQKKAQAERIIAALKERQKDLLKTQEWMRAEAERKAKDIAERAKLIASIKGVSIKTAEERRAVQTATAGVKGAEKLFEKESSTQFAMLAEKVGLHVNQRPTIPSEQEISLPELRQLEAKVRALRDLGIEKRDAMKLARRQYIEGTADAITAQILTSVKPSTIPNVGEESHVRTRSNQLREDIQWIADEKGRKVWQFQELDGFKDGTITKALYDNAIRMENAVRSSVRTVLERITARLEKGGITGKTYNVERTLPNGQVVTQAQVLLVAINSLRQDNLYHLMAGNKYTEETIAQSIQSMTPEEVDVANMMLDNYGGSWPAVNAAYEYSNSGESLPELENYVHIELERGDTVGQPEGRSATELLHQDVIDRGWIQNSTTKDWEKSRVPRSAIPLREDPIATFISYIGQTTDFIHREGVSQDILQIVKDVHVKDAFTIRMGREGYRSVLQYAKDLGNPAGALGLQAVPPQWRKLERLVRNSRLAVSCSILALRASKMVTAGASYMTSAGQFGPETMMYGTAKLVSNPNAAMRLIKEFMPVLYDRVLDPIRTEAEVTMSELEKNWQRGVSKLRDWENVTFRIADTTDIASAAIGGLARAQREHPERTLEENAFEVQRAILATHASELVEDKSDVYKQSELARIFTAFTGEATAAADYLNYLGRGSAKGKIPAHRAFRQLLFTVVGVALIMRLADRIARGREKNPNAGKWYDTWWGYVALEAIENMIPILGRYITQGLQGMTWGSAPVALQPFEVIKNIFSSASKGNWKAVAGFIIELGGYVTAAPVKGYLEAQKWLFPNNPVPKPSGGSTTLPSFGVPHLPLPKLP